MASNGGQIRFGVGFDVDQSSLSKIKSSLKEIQNFTTKDIQIIDPNKTEKDLNQIKQSASQLQAALQKSFNTDLGTLNVSKFNEALHKLDLNKIQRDLASAGTIGQKAFKDIATQALTTNMQLKQTNNIIDQMGTTMMNTIKWGISSSVMNSFTSSVQEAFGFVKSLDTSLTNIRIVTGQSRDEMAQFAVEANNAAAALGRQTKEYTQAALTFYQQGLSDQEVKSRTETTLKASNITGQNSAQMADELTAVWNGFQVEMGKEADVVSKLAAVADSSASDMSELATAMSKVASAANSMGVDVDQLTAQIATIVSVTRSAPESVGNALKTIYSRIADIKAGIDEEEVSLGNYSAKIASLGFNILDANGNLKDMGEFLEEVGEGWQNLSREQQVYLARTMAGQRQYNNLVTLFDNWDKYIQNVNTSLNSQGTLEEKNSRYMESLAAHMKELEAAKEGLMISITDSDSFKTVIDGLTTITNLTAKFVDAIGGGGTALVGLGSIAFNVFGNQLANSLSTFILNLQNAKENAANLAAQMEIVATFKNIDINSAQFDKLVSMKEQVLNLDKALTLEEQNQANELIKMTNEIQNQQNAWEANKKSADDYLNRLGRANQQEVNQGILLDETIISQNQGKSISDLNVETLREYNIELKSEANYLKDLKKDFNEYSQAMEESITSMGKSTKGLKEYKASVEALHDNILTKANEFRLEEKTLNSVNEAYKKYQESTSKTPFNIEAQVRAGRAFRNALEQAFSEAQELSENARNAIKQALDGIENDLEAKQTQISSAFKNLIDVGALRQQVSQAVGVVSALGQISSAIMSIKNLGSIWSNEDLSTGEKLLQIMTNIGFVLPMLVSSYGKLKDTLGITSSIFDVINTKYKAHQTLQASNLAQAKALEAEKAKELAQEKALAAQEQLNIALTQKHTLAKQAFYEVQQSGTVSTATKLQLDQAETAVITANNNAVLANTAASAANTAAEGANATAKTAETAATTAATAANNALNASLMANPFILAGVAIAAAIAGVAIAYDHFNMSAKEAAEAIDNFNQKFEQSQQTMTSNQKSIVELKSVAEEYDKLSEKAGQYDATINKLTDEEKHRYSEIKNLIASYNEEAIVGYDNEGNAILSVNNVLEETVEILKEKNALEAEGLYGDNWKNYTRAKEVERDDARQKLETLKKSKADTQNNNFVESMSSIQMALGEAGVYGDETPKVKMALQTFERIYEEGAESFTKNKDAFDRAVNTLKNSSGFEEVTDALITQIDNAQEQLNKSYDVYDKDIEEAEIELANKLKLDPNVIIAKAQNDDAETNQQLEELGEELGTSRIAALSKGYAIGLSKNEDGSLTEDEAIEKVKSYNQYLLGAFSDDKNLDQDISDIQNHMSEYGQSVTEYYKQLREYIQKEITNNSTIGSGSKENSKKLFIDALGLDADNWTGGNKSEDLKNVFVKQIEDAITDTSVALQEKFKDTNLLKDIEWDTELSNLNVDILLGNNTEALTDNFTEWYYAVNNVGEALNKVNQEQQLMNNSANNIVEWNALLTGYNDVIEAVKKGKELTKSEKENLEALADQHEELRDVEIAATDEYAAKLREVMDLQDKQGIASLTQLRDLQKEKINSLREELEKYKQQIDKGDASTEIKLQFVAVTDALDKTIQEYEQTEHNIDFIIQADARGEFEESFAIVEKLQTLTSSIPEEMKISLDDARNLVKAGYAGMLVDCQHTTDGMIQLSKEQVQSYVDDRQAEYQAAIQARKDELDVKIEAQKAVVDAAQQKLDALESYDKAQTEAAKNEAKKDYDAAVNKYTTAQQAYEEILKSQAEEKEKEVTNDDAATSDMLDNILKRDEENIKAENDLAVAAQQACNQALSSYDALIEKAQTLGKHNQAAMDALKTGKYVPYGGMGPTSAGGGAIEQTASVDTSAASHSSEKLETALDDNTSAIEDNSDKIADDANERSEQIQAARDDLKTQQDILAELQLSREALDAANNAVDTAQKGGKGKGGGGKGKSEKEKKEKEPDKMEPFEDNDLDNIQGKFHDIDLEIQRLTKDLEKLQKLQNRYLGSALVHNLNEQLKIAKKQKAAYGEKLKIAKEELEAQKKKLEAQGIEIGKDGNIKNYTEALKQKQKEVNALVDKYNSATKEGQENLKGQVEAQKKNYNELKNQMNAYEQLNGQTIPEIEAQIAQIEEMIIELQIEKFNAKIELHLDWQSFLQDYKDFQNSTKEFFNSRATMFVDLETGETSGHNDNYENALAAGKAKAENARIARQQAAAAEEAYQTEMKNSKKKKYKEDLADKYGIDTSDKSNKQIKKELQKAIADAYEARNEAIKEQKEKADAEIDRNFKDGFNISSDEQVEALNEYRDRINEINQTALEERTQAQKDLEDNQKKFKDNQKDIKNSAKEGAQKTEAQKDLEDFYGVNLTDKDEFKKFKNTMVVGYQDALKEIEDARKQSLDEAEADYNNAISNITDSGKVKIVDVFKTYTGKMDELAEASDQMINGTLLANGSRGKSIIEESMEHAEELAERIQRMNDNTKYDKQGNKIMGTDDLKVGTVNPLTGEKIKNKKELKQVKKQIGKDKSGQVYADMQKKIYEDGKKYAQSLQDQITTLQQQIQQAWENYYAAIDKVLEYTKEIIDDYEYINDMYDMQLKYLKLIGEEDSDRVKDIKEKQKANQDAQNEYYKQQIVEAKKGLQKAKENHGIESEEYKKYYEQLKSLSKDYYESRLKQIEDLRDEAIKANEDIIETLNKNVTNQLGIQETSERWNNTKTEADSYLNSLEKVNALQSLRAKYQEAIDSTDDIKQQEELRRIMEEQLGALQQADYLSEKEVTNAENLLDVTKKQMALEEAKQNKSKMRLRRDSQGNYTYQFVADENNIKNKQQELQDSLKKMNDDTTKALRENYDEQTRLFDEFQQKLKEISDKYLSGESGWTQEQYAERINYTTNQYEKQKKIYEAQQDRMETNYENSNVLSMVGAAANAGGLANESDLKQFMADTGISAEEAQVIREILQSLGSEDGEYSILKLLGNTNLQEIMDQMSQGSYDTISNIGGTNELLGTVEGDLLNNHTEAMQQVEDARDKLLKQGIDNKDAIDTETKKLTEEMIKDTSDTIDKVGEHKDAITGLQEDGNSKLDDLYNQASALEEQNLEAIGGLQATLDDLLATLQNMAEESEMGSGSGTIGKNKLATVGTTTEDGKIKQTAATYTMFKASGKTAEYSKKIVLSEKKQAEYDQALEWINSGSGRIQILSKKANKNGYVHVQTTLENGKTVDLGWIKADQLVGYDTGGYTGDWSDTNGKLAMLHKKELVLNQTDTSNILDAVQIARSIADAISNLGIGAVSNLGAAVSSVLGGLTGSSSTVDQNVTIQANFPNVSSHTEIETALMNLVNVASQKATPNKRAY